MLEETTDWPLRFQGAESRIKFGTADGKAAVLKERFVKKYRHPLLDQRLTKERLRAEVRSIKKIKDKCADLGKLMPDILFFDDRNIIMTEVVNAKTSCAFITEALKTGDDLTWLFEGIGDVVGKIHRLGIIHGDLTTSNILINDKKQLIPIDFGLASSSTSQEDRAVDLYVLERALQSTHVDEKLFQISIDQYVKSFGNGGDVVIKRLDAVRLRGRKRTMAG